MTIQFPRVGDRFLDRYEIVEVLGAGGMSRVYGAVQDGLDRKVAIKLLAPAGADNLTDSQFDKIAARFEREAKLISSFRSSHTVVMYDYGRAGDHLFMILEHVDGLNLRELVEATGPLPAERVARIIRQALASLAEAHQMGILHRDIKPQNIMVYEHLGDPDNTKLLDFGIAKAIGETGKDQRKLTEERTIVGTPSYMSPEQILGEQLSPASDLYSLGLVAYEMLFGIVAVDADSAVSTMARHLAPAPIEIPDDREMPPMFLDILRRMINKDVSQRYQSAAEIIEDLNAWDGGDPHLSMPRISSTSLRQQDTLDGEPPIAPVPQPTEQATGSNNQPLVIGSALLLTLAILLAVGVVVALVWMMQDQPAEAAPADTPSVAAVTNVEPPEPPTVEPPAEPEAGEAVAVPEPAEPSVPADSAEAGKPTEAKTAEPEPEAEPEAEPANKVAAAKKKPAEKQAQQAQPAEPVDREEPEAGDAVEPPEPLVVEPAQPEPAPVEAAQTAPAPEPEEKVAEKSDAKKKPAAKETDEKTSKKKKKKKRSAPPLSF